MLDKVILTGAETLQALGLLILMAGAMSLAWGVLVRHGNGHGRGVLLIVVGIGLCDLAGYGAAPIGRPAAHSGVDSSGARHE